MTEWLNKSAYSSLFSFIWPDVTLATDSHRPNIPRGYKWCSVYLRASSIRFELWCSQFELMVEYACAFAYMCVSSLTNMVRTRVCSGLLFTVKEKCLSKNCPICYVRRILSLWPDLATNFWSHEWAQMTGLLILIDLTILRRLGGTRCNARREIQISVTLTEVYFVSSESNNQTSQSAKTKSVAVSLEQRL